MLLNSAQKSNLLCLKIIGENALCTKILSISYAGIMLDAYYAENYAQPGSNLKLSCYKSLKMHPDSISECVTFQNFLGDILDSPRFGMLGMHV